MVDRLMRTALTLLLVVVLLSVLSSVLVQIVRAVATAVGHALGGVVSLLLATFFLIGLCARVVHAWNNRDPRAAGEQRQLERRVRVAVRRVAEDVPLHGAPQHLTDDPDPALPFDRQGGA